MSLTRASDQERVDVIMAVHRTVRLCRTFEPSNAALDQPVTELSAALAPVIALENEVELRLEDGASYLNRWPVRLDRAGHERAGELRRELGLHGMGGLVFRHVLRPETLRQLLGLFAAPADPKSPEASYRALVAGLARLGLGDSVSPLSFAHVRATALVGRAAIGPARQARRAYARAFGLMRKVLDEWDDRALRPVLLVRLRRLVQTLVTVLEQDPDRGLALALLGGLGHPLAEHALGTTIISLGLGRAARLPRARLSEIGIAAALHCIGRRGLAEDLKLPGDAQLDRANKGDVRQAPYRAVAGLIAERILDPTLGTALSAAFEHTASEGYPELDEDWSPLFASRVIAVAHTFDARARRLGPVAAMRKMLESFRLDPRQMIALIELLGHLPPGTRVSLSDGRTGVVARPTAKPDRPRVRVRSSAESEVVDLATPGAPSIVRVDPAIGRIETHAPFLFV